MVGWVVDTEVLGVVMDVDMLLGRVELVTSWSHSSKLGEGGPRLMLHDLVFESRRSQAWVDLS